jgi:hypothetical protein
MSDTTSEETKYVYVYARTERFYEGELQLQLLEKNSRASPKSGYRRN